MALACSSVRRFSIRVIASFGLNLPTRSAAKMSGLGGSMSPAPRLTVSKDPHSRIPPMRLRFFMCQPLASISATGTPKAIAGRIQARLIRTPTEVRNRQRWMLCGWPNGGRARKTLD